METQAPLAQACIRRWEQATLACASEWCGRLEADRLTTDRMVKTQMLRV